MVRGEGHFGATLQKGFITTRVGVLIKLTTGVPETLSLARWIVKSQGNSRGVRWPRKTESGGMEKGSTDSAANDNLS